LWRNHFKKPTLKTTTPQNLNNKFITITQVVEENQEEVGNPGLRGTRTLKRGKGDEG